MIPVLDDVTMGEVRVVKVPGLGFLDEKAADRLQEIFEVWSLGSFLDNQFDVEWSLEASGRSVFTNSWNTGKPE